jgi:hypothetical protein
MTNAVFVERLQSRARELPTLPTVEEPLLDGTGARRAVVDEALFIAASLAVRVLPVVLAAAAIDTAVRECLRVLH